MRLRGYDNNPILKINQFVVTPASDVKLHGVSVVMVGFSV